MLEASVMEEKHGGYGTGLFVKFFLVLPPHQFSDLDQDRSLAQHRTGYPRENAVIGPLKTDAATEHVNAWGIDQGPDDGQESHLIVDCYEKIRVSVDALH
ncbi:hypothetical protein VNO77_04369 [Canavalia gladiata]|uniref:Uncharacterized protein n=1 Tax=Canavalia gladiata TaxID=3824 RepID=A0AAN9N219_CANGL